MGYGQREMSGMIIVGSISPLVGDGAIAIAPIPQCVLTAAMHVMFRMPAKLSDVLQLQCRLTIQSYMRTQSKPRGLQNQLEAQHDKVELIQAAEEGLLTCERGEGMT